MWRKIGKNPSIFNHRFRKLRKLQAEKKMTKIICKHIKIKLLIARDKEIKGKKILKHVEEKNYIIQTRNVGWILARDKGR